VYDDKQLAWFDGKGVKRPDIFKHELVDTKDNPLSAQLPKIKCANWRRQGNFLIADTEYGEWSQYLDPDYIVLGDGPDGLPLLKKIDL
jgi:hypothetical protein